ncbi:MAG: lysine--tRNA ligase, partial [Thermoprotei archaeon]
MIHWLDSVVDRLIYKLKEKEEPIVCNGGLSVSGLQHVGRLRGEVTYVNSIVKELRKRGIEAVHTIVLYVLDAWKGKIPQVRQFRQEGEIYKG